MHKKNSKGRVNSQQSATNLSAEQLVEQARNALDRGKARDAIDCLKLAGKLNKNAGEIRHLLYRAYWLREDQLRSKGMSTEADVVRKMALSMRPSFDSMTEAELFDYISKASVSESLAACSEFSKNRPLPEGANTRLAYRLMVLSEWEALEALEPSHPLRRHSIQAQQAVALMNDGEWESSAQMLKDVPRTSPYTPMRLFCRAMTQFYQENDAEMQQTLSRIPDNFPLHIVVENLKQYVLGSDATHDFFNATPVNLHALMHEIMLALTPRKFKQIVDPVRKLAKAVFPANPDAAVRYILEILMMGAKHSGIADEDYLEMMFTMLPRGMAKQAEAKLRFGLISEAPFSIGTSYLTLLKNEIADPVHRNIVFSMVMLDIAKKLPDINPFRLMTKLSVPQTPEMEFLQKESDLEMIVAMLAAHAFERDPLNRDAYEFLVKLPRTQRKIRNIVEKVLLKAVAAFPEDPCPCLELATVYYENSAFRKAENILAEALRRAPHDNRVIDRHALSFLVSAWKNFQRSKFHLMEIDFQKAAQFKSKIVAPFLLEKRILYDVTKNEKPFSWIEESLTQFDVLERMRILALLYGDIKAMPKNASSVNQLNQIEKLLKKEFMSLPSPSTADITTLLRPLPAEVRIILPHGNVANTLLSKLKNLFSAIPDIELIDAFLLIFQRGILWFMAAELQKRLRKRHHPHRLQMRFFLITIGHLTNTCYDSMGYEELLYKADSKARRSLQKLSERLSRHATGKLKLFLEQLNLGDIDSCPYEFDTPGCSEPTDRNDSIFMGFDDDIKELGRIIESIQGQDSPMPIELELMITGAVELLVDELACRNDSKNEILTVRQDACSHPQIQQIIKGIARMMDITGRNKFSREANILFPKELTQPQQLTLLDS